MRTSILPLLSLCLLCLGCATAERSFRELDALRQIDVDVHGTRQETLAGVSVDRLRNPNRLAVRDAAILAAAVQRRDLPLSLVVDLDARNPSSNHQTARILGVDWRLLLDDREAVTGSLGAQPAIPAGGSIRIPVGLKFDLLDLFDDDLEELVRVALAFAGYGSGSDVQASLMMTPTVETAVGPFRYPTEIRVRLN